MIIETYIDHHNKEHFISFLNDFNINFEDIGCYISSIGYYTIWVEIPDTEEAKEMITFINLKYGSLENLYKQFCDNMEKISGQGIIRYGY